MKKIKLSVILLVCGWILIFSACVRAKDPESVVKALIEAVEDMNSKAALRCVLPELRGQYESGLRVAAELLSTEPEALLSAIVGITYVTAGNKINYEILDISITDDTHATVLIRVKDKDRFQDLSILCTKYRRGWYISN